MSVVFRIIHCKCLVWRLCCLALVKGLVSRMETFAGRLFEAAWFLRVTAKSLRVQWDRLASFDLPAMVHGFRGAMRRCPLDYMDAMQTLNNPSVHSNTRSISLFQGNVCVLFLLICFILSPGVPITFYVTS